MLRRTITALQLHILLLLAALFNALAGVPLHETRHMREALRSMQVASAAASGVQADAADEARLHAASGEQETEETHATCAWCLTHALDAGLGQPLAYQLPVPEPPRAALPTTTLTFTAQPMRWPLAARDPPPAKRA